MQQTSFKRGVVQGFGSRNKAPERLTDHEWSQMHKESVEKLAAQSNSADIALQLHAQCRESQCFHREMLMNFYHLSRQGFPFRGHSETPESFEGNLYQLLLLRAEGKDKMIAWLRRKENLSPDIVNEIIGQVVLRSILTQIKSAMWFFLIADD